MAAPVTVNGGVLNINAGNTVPISGLTSINGGVINIGATNTVTIASGGLNLSNSTLSFSSTSTNASSVPVTISFGSSSGSLTNLPLNGNALRFEARNDRRFKQL